ncbi:hypothetical protein OE810_02335 [Rhodobacteraceae bacterium XHP0102]|nr:hypothetical protein [Rhodobacteraceae bacterium XHP0102]
MEWITIFMSALVAIMVVALLSAWAIKRKNNAANERLLLLLFQAAEATDDVNHDCHEMRQFLDAVKAMREFEGGVKAGKKLAFMTKMTPYYGQASLTVRDRARSIVDQVVHNKIN